jgi:hypothetical protein
VARGIYMKRLMVIVRRKMKLIMLLILKILL